ncbi:hypothetical protein AMTR_s00068p00112460 [Amborella trichopoda]|uniref:Uncharacterized protein n=1 Tax=Amborella trichopoda TaxID=13333 RepID=U5DD12_AMBTC|nr:hypothetical protein AMTR_s00068p00112460 [Amborella trichopoda]
MGPIAQEHAIAARQELSIQEVYAIEEANEETNEDTDEEVDEEAEDEVIVLEPVEVVEVAPLPEPVDVERRFNFEPVPGKGITIRQQDEGPSQISRARTKQSKPRHRET